MPLHGHGGQRGREREREGRWHGRGGCHGRGILTDGQVEDGNAIRTCVLVVGEERGGRRRASGLDLLPLWPGAGVREREEAHARLGLVSAHAGKGAGAPWVERERRRRRSS